MKGPEEDKEEEEHLSDEYDEPLDPEEDWLVCCRVPMGGDAHCCICAFF